MICGIKSWDDNNMKRNRNANAIGVIIEYLRSTISVGSFTGYVASQAPNAESCTDYVITQAPIAGSCCACVMITCNKDQMTGDLITWSWRMAGTQVSQGVILRLEVACYYQNL